MLGATSAGSNAAESALLIGMRALYDMVVACSAVIRNAPHVPSNTAAVVTVGSYRLCGAEYNCRSCQAAASSLYYKLTVMMAAASAGYALMTAAAAELFSNGWFEIVPKQLLESCTSTIHHSRMDLFLKQNTTWQCAHLLLLYQPNSHHLCYHLHQEGPAE